MARERIYQLAAQWGMSSREFIERLDGLGIKGKKAQSVLDDEGTRRVREELGPATIQGVMAEGDSAAVGVKSASKKPGVVIRRRKKTADADQAGANGASLMVPAGLAASTQVDLAPELLASFDLGEFSHAASLAAQPPGAGEPVQTADSSATAPDPLTGGTEPEIDEFTPAVPREEQDRLAEEMLSAASSAAATAESDDGPAVSETRVLGRIDLTKKPAARPAAEKPEAGKEKDKEKEKTEAERPARKRKRKVVRKEDMFDALERSYKARPRKKRAAPGQKLKQTELTTPKASKRVIKINEVTTPGELARTMGVKVGEVLTSLVGMGVMKTVNDPIDLDTATLVAEEFEHTIENTAVTAEDLLAEESPQDEEGITYEPRPPIVTVMGHVDHGKTSLLDAFRHTDVVASEHGGITQHIGAYQVDVPQGKLCFLDTPGHAAFSAMRARGTGLTDIVVLVGAAADGVMPQTIEASNHAKDAAVPVVVAVNKIDRPDANPDRIKQQLAEHGLQPEDWGGDVQCMEVSATKKTGLDELLEAISLLAQIHELKAPAVKRARGVIVEARLDKGRGPVATLLVQQGVLERGDSLVCGRITGRIRAMTDHNGKPVKQAGPSTPVEIIGLDDVPQAGDRLDVVENTARADQVAEHRREAARSAQMLASSKMSLEDLQAQMASGAVDELKVIVKADTQGSAEALTQSLEKLGNDEVRINIVHSAVGAIRESDVQLARASNAIVVGFHVRPEAKARATAEREAIDIRLHTVIYEVIDEIRLALEGMLAPDQKEVSEGRAEVRDTFRVPGTVIAGSYVLDGRIVRGARARLLRDNVVVHTGTVGSLRRFKEDVRDVQTGYECGIGLDRFSDIKTGDVIECFRIEEVKRSLDATEPATP